MPDDARFATTLRRHLAQPDEIGSGSTYMPAEAFETLPLDAPRPIAARARRVSVTYWLDLPCAASLATCRSALDAVGRVVVEDARERDRGLPREFEQCVLAWCARAAERLSDVPGDAERRSHDDDLHVTRDQEMRLTLASVAHRWSRSGAASEPGVSLVVVLGQDRWIVRVALRAEPRDRGLVLSCDARSHVRLGSAISALAADCDRLDEDLLALDRRVGAALLDASPARITELLADRTELLSRRIELELRRRRFLTAYDRLATGRHAARFVLDEHDRRDLERLAGTLDGIRTQLAELPQLLLSAESWRGAQRAESLSLAAAALIPPTLVAGVLGANVLPWSTEARWHALVGMLLLMAASAYGAVGLVKLRVFADVERRRLAGLPAPAVGAVAALAGAVGLLLLLAGTTSAG